MKILSLNRGSSSIKCSLYELDSFPDQFVEPIWEDKIEDKELTKEMFPKEKIDCIGHRIVHGGEKYTKSVLIDSDVKEEIKKLGSLAPLHNLADLEGIEMLEKLFPGVPQVAVFDTAFHHTLPPEAYTYPGPYEWVAQGIRKYGFHGISFQYCTRVVGHGKVVICHLGSGASLCALKDGKSIDTTMGFTPLDGLMMDTRSGSVDPGILLHLLKSKTPEELSKELYEKSGLLGVSGISSDMRDILKSDSARARLTLDVYIHRLCSCIGSMVAALGGLDVLVFTGGIGENSEEIREEVVSRLSFLSPKVLTVHTQEEFEIARECYGVIQNGS